MAVYLPKLSPSCYCFCTCPTESAVLFTF